MKAKWPVLFFMLLFPLPAVPVLAESASEPAEVIVASEEQVEALPSAADIAAGLSEAEELEAQEQRERETPQATQEREASVDAYADLTAAQAQTLLQEQFAEQLAVIDQDPARALSDARLDQVLGPNAARVTVDGNTMLVEGTIPVRAPDEEGDLAKVDLDLESGAQGYVPENPITEMTLPADASESVSLGDEGFAIAPLLTEPANPAHPLDGEDVQYYETQRDSDLIVSPLAAGVELFSLLRSAESPEELRFQVALPAGAELRANGEGGAEVVRAEERLVRIPAPIAFDAQGADVPVEMQVEGNALVLRVEHRSLDVAYPLLVDPEAILENWYEGGNDWYHGGSLWALEPGSSSWVWGSNNGGRFWAGTTPINSAPGLSNRGLFISATNTTGAQPANQFGQFTLTAPGSDSYIAAALINPFWRWDNQNCPFQTYPEPHDYSGLWSDDWGWATFHSNWARVYGYGIETPSEQLKGTPDEWRARTGHVLVIGMGTGNGSAKIPCWRDLYAGGVNVWMDDWTPPTINSVTGVPPLQWLSDASPINISVNAGDTGLGVYKATITPEGSLAIPKPLGCTGLHGNLCPNSTGVAFSLTGLRFAEGVRSAGVTVEDPTGKTSGTTFFQTRVDRTPPEVTLDGQLADATGADAGEAAAAEEVEKLRLPVYKLEIGATDIGTVGDANQRKRSGVKSIEVFLDGKATPEKAWTQGCATDSCPMSQTYLLALSQLQTAGVHTLEIKTKDQADNLRTRKIEFEYIPATGIKDEYVMHYFPLPDGTSNEAEEEHPDRPELAVNVLNGNLVYREQDIEVEGAAVDLEVERYYNSMLPDSENTEWGDGWTLAQTPDLEPQKADEAQILDSSGAMEGGVGLPTQVGAKRFDPALQATLTKMAGGGFELADDTGESATSVAFDASGQTEALLTEGYAKVDYTYEGGALAEIEVVDPATFAADPSELEIPAPQLITQPTFASSFGSNGTADGQLNSPGDVAVDPKGSVWVVDKGNNRIQKFDSSGNFLAKFGSTGAGAGQFNRPTAIAIAPSGDLLVTDAGNGRVQRFSVAGAFISQFGTKGTGNAQFAGSGPEGIAVDSAGNIWVADTYGGRLQKFSSGGEFLKVAGSKGSGSGQLGEPTGIDVAPNGDVWVADWQNNRLSIFNGNGEFLSQFGSAGAGNGQFSHPDEVEIDKLGNVWIGDQGKNRVQQFDLAGQFRAKFGSAGSGSGQFNFAYPLGIAADSKGGLWVADVNNHSIQQWAMPIERPAFHSTFGSVGGGDGQLSAPADVAVGVEGDLWVVDKANNRLQKFDSTGKFLAKVGSLGSGDGQFSRPTAVAVDRDGNLFVADSNNNRIQKLTADGQFLAKFGAAGSGNGQFSSPEGIATDLDGNIWVADSGNGRVQKFNEQGEFLAVVGSKGSSPGQLGRPIGIDIDPYDNLWVGDLQNHRVSIFQTDGDFVTQIGGLGSAPGQFSRPSGVEIDGGNVWVADQNNGRVERFNLNGEYVGQFGVKGSGEGQFSFPTATSPVGIAAAANGRIWIADVNNHRVQRWQIGNYAFTPQTLDLSDGDPSVEVETTGNLVSAVTGSAAGEHLYQHEADKLTSYEGPQGESTYQYDGGQRLSKVTLANGTWAEIKYLTDNRVQSVTVARAGSNPKTTNFQYTDAPTRRTVVIPPDAPHVTYDIGDDGSILRWRNASQPPTFDDLAGSLYEAKEKEDGLEAGDQILHVQAHSEEGIAEIHVIANGSQIVHETQCEKAQVLACKTLQSQWVTNTELHAPGHLQLEVLVTDRLGQIASERFWVDIPEPPPPPAPGNPIPPKFADIERFRDDYGLEVVFPVVSEIERNERIFNLINKWYEGDPVARASADKWGVPLLPADVAELEWRERFYNLDAERIDRWVEETKPKSYAGYYLDHRAGGIVHVGFIDDQAERLASLKASLSLVGRERLQVYPTTPTVPYLSVQATSEAVSDAAESNVGLGEMVVGVEIDKAGGVVHVGTPNVAHVESILNAMLGPGAPFAVEYEADDGALLSGRFRNEGRMRAGDAVFSRHFTAGHVHNGNELCTAGFGAKDKVGDSRGQALWRLFVLTAGHCSADLSQPVFRSTDSDPLREDHWKEVGIVKRTGYGQSGMVDTDADAISVESEGVVPQGIFGTGGALKATESAATAKIGNVVCFSGARTQGVSCGPIVARTSFWAGANDGVARGGYWVEFNRHPVVGDSGAPVYSIFGPSIGLVSAGRHGLNETLVEPLLNPPGMNSDQIPGILKDPFLQPLSLKLGQ